MRHFGTRNEALYKIGLKSGDTSLIGGKRVSKDDIRLQAYGTVDELNSFLGLLRAKTVTEPERQLIFEIQNDLFALGANLATDVSETNLPESAQITQDKIEKIEKTIDKYQSELPPLNCFIVYGEDELSALCHVCRAVARRAEREIITLHRHSTADINVISYVNRLSDLLFVLARHYTQHANKNDFLWKKYRMI